MSDAQITSGPRWYAATRRFDKHSVYLFGTGVAMRVSALEPRSLPGLRVFAASGIMTATWRQFGVTYLATVECEDPEHDLRCTGQQYLRDLVKTLVVARGAP